MKIAFISTFNNLEDLNSFINLNSKFFGKNKNVFCFASINLEKKVLKPEWMNLLNKFDKSYSEGWNNVINEYRKSLKKFDGICFVGNGDELLNINFDLIEKINVPLIYRMKRDNRNTKNKFNNRYFWFVNIGVWTPSVIWPTQLILNYKFPEKFKIASDVDIFFNYKKLLLNDSLFVSETLLNMHSGGISTNNNGADEFKIIASKYNSIFLCNIGYYFKLIRSLLK